MNLTDDQWLRLKQLRGLCWIALEDLQDHLVELDEFIGECEGFAEPIVNAPQSSSISSSH